MDDLPSGFSARPPTIDDAPAVANVIAACQLADAGKSEITAEEVRDDWHALNLGEEALIVSDQDGRVVASVDLVNRGFVSIAVYGYVHPEFRGRGIGRFLVRWGDRWARDRIDRAPPAARVEVRHYVASSNTAARDLLAAEGYAPVRNTYVMAIDLDHPPSAPEWPEGVTVRAFVPGQDERAAHETVEESFKDMWGRPRGSLEAFISRTESETFDASLWFLAERADGVIGVCLARALSGNGWIDTVGVLRPWRTRGVGLAMLRHAFAELERRGIRHIRLSVDAESITSAPRLYARAGMHIEQSYVLYQKVVRDGVDMSQRGDG